MQEERVILASHETSKSWLTYYNGNVKHVNEGRTTELNGINIEDNVDSLLMGKQSVDDWSFLLTQEIEYNEEYQDVESFFDDKHSRMSMLISGAFATGRTVAIFDYKSNDVTYYDGRKFNVVKEWLAPNKISNPDWQIGVEVIPDKSTDPTYIYFNGFYIKRTGKKNDEVISTGKNMYELLIFHNDISYPFGKAIYADAQPISNQIDLTYADMNEDRASSKPVILTDISAFDAQVNKDKVKTLAQENKTIEGKSILHNWLYKKSKMFRGVFLGKPKDQIMPVHKISFEMKVDEYIKTLNAHLSLFSKKCRLGDDYYSFDKATNSIKTATEVLDKNSDIARNLRKFRDIYKEFLKNVYETLHDTELQDTFVKFGDGILTDDKYEREQAFKEAIETDIPQLMIDYLVRWRGYEESEAKAMVIANSYNHGDGTEGIPNTKGKESFNKEDKEPLFKSD